jgi:hypothetical protein
LEYILNPFPQIHLRFFCSILHHIQFWHEFRMYWESCEFFKFPIIKEDKMFKILYSIYHYISRWICFWKGFDKSAKKKSAFIRYHKTIIWYNFQKIPTFSSYLQHNFYILNGQNMYVYKFFSLTFITFHLKGNSIKITL